MDKAETVFCKFAEDSPVYKKINNVPTQEAIERLADEWLNRKPYFANVRKEVSRPDLLRSAGKGPNLRK